MKNLLKYTYLLDLNKIKESIEDLWQRYQGILDNKESTWEDLNEARAILYFLGYLYPEKIALNSLESRIRYIEPVISLDDFLLAIDSKDEKVLEKYRENEGASTLNLFACSPSAQSIERFGLASLTNKKFNRLKEFYLIIKNIKNRVKDNTYLDEGRFNEIYSKLKPKDYF